jgi:hypothetical protein
VPVDLRSQSADFGHAHVRHNRRVDCPCAVRSATAFSSKETKISPPSQWLAQGVSQHGHFMPMVSGVLVLLAAQRRKGADQALREALDDDGRSDVGLDDWFEVRCRRVRQTYRRGRGQRIGLGTVYRLDWC